MNTDNSSSTVTCGCVILVINLLLGGWSVNYLLAIFLAKTIPFWGAMLLGLFVGEFSIPIAFVVAILKYFNVF